MKVVRWGRSAYETPADIALEREGARALGLDFHLAEDQKALPPLDEADALVVTSGVKVGPAVLDALRGRLVITTTSGFDHIDIDAARARGIRVLRLPEARRDAVIEHALGAMVGLMRNLPRLDREARQGTWARAALPGLSPRALSRSRILVVGQGVIGRKMAQVLDALGAEVLATDPAGVPAPAREVDLDAALPDLDAITVHCSLEASSRNLLSRRRLEGLPSTAVVVNTARGEVLDVRAAVELVRAGRLRGLAVDVFPIEPYPELASAADLPSVWFTPHSAGFTHDLGRRVAEGVTAALYAWVHGRPLPHPVV